MPERMDPAEAERIAAAIDWQPTCLDGQERQTIVRQIGDMVGGRLRAVERAAVAYSESTRDPAGDPAARWRDLNDALARLGAEHAAPSVTPGPACQYCGADCSDGRSWDGGDLYACPACADARAASSVTPPPADAVERVARWLFDNHAAAGVRSWGWDDILPGAQEGYRTEAADLLALVTEGDEARAEVERLRAQRGAALALHCPDEIGGRPACEHCSMAGLDGAGVPVGPVLIVGWPCPTAEALGVAE